MSVLSKLCRTQALTKSTKLFAIERKNREIAHFSSFWPVTLNSVVQILKSFAGDPRETAHANGKHRWSKCDVAGECC